MKAGIQVDVLDLLVVLHKGGKKDGVGQRHIYSRANQPELGFAPGSGKVNGIVIAAECQTHIRLKTIAQVGNQVVPLPIRIIAACTPTESIIEDALRLLTVFQSYCRPLVFSACS